jgi:hypothetical protein
MADTLIAELEAAAGATPKPCCSPPITETYEAVSACKIQFLDFPISDEDTAYNEGVEACISIIEALKTPQP